MSLSPWRLLGNTLRQFAALERQTLYLGLSDGARTDVFRRFNPNLSHEQVRQSHELTDDRVAKLLAKLRKGLAEITKAEVKSDQCRFRTIVLLDDFSASGISYVRSDGSSLDGKIGSFLNSLLDPDYYLASLAIPEDLDLHVVLYMATDRAIDHIENELIPVCNAHGIRAFVKTVYPLGKHVKITRGDDIDFDKIIDTYYDPDNETDSTRLGGTNLKYGFAGCGLPLVLSHNTPNNSIGLLWALGSAMRPLFPRVTRHKDRA